VTQLAKQYRGDLAAEPEGPNHGFNVTLNPPATGAFTSEKVCVTALDPDLNGGNTLLRCYPVVVGGWT
jgi:hypothetical protein